MTVSIASHAGHDLWFADLRAPAAACDACAASLSPAERRRAARFPCLDDRRRFVLAHAMLRTALSTRTRLPPHDIEIVVGPQGKPMLAGRSPLHFNVSRAGDLAAFVFSRHAVGVDLVAEPSGARLLPASNEFCSPSEHAALALLDPTDRAAALVVIWARKEALLKATGEGLTRLPTSLTLWEGADAPAELLVHRLGRHWLVQDAYAPAGYRAAVATEAG